MTLVATAGWIPWPHFPSGLGGSTPALNTLTIDAADEKIALIFRAPKSGSLTGGVFHVGNVVTGATLDFRLETVDDTTGAPTGTLRATNTNAAQVVQDTDDNTGFQVTFTAPVAVTIGELLSLVIVNPVVSPGNMQLNGLTEAAPGGFPYRSQYLTGAWVASASSPCFAPTYSDGYVAFADVWPIKAVNSTLWNSGSNPDRRGLRFQLPFAARCTGCWLVGMGTSGSDMDIILYDTDAITALVTATLDKDVHGATTNARLRHVCWAPVELAAGVFYRLIGLPKDVTNTKLHDFDVLAAAVMDAIPGGQNCHYTTCNGAPANEASWTQTLTKRPWMGLWLDQVHDGAGGGRIIG